VVDFVRIGPRSGWSPISPSVKLAACAGGSSRLPLGLVSLTRNLFMVGMALWMLFAGAPRGMA
jgi:hypothetical protein